MAAEIAFDMMSCILSFASTVTLPPAATLFPSPRKAFVCVLIFPTSTAAPTDAPPEPDAAVTVFFISLTSCVAVSETSFEPSLP